jgi:hypothetical protein
VAVSLFDWLVRFFTRHEIRATPIEMWPEGTRAVVETHVREMRDAEPGKSLSYLWYGPVLPIFTDEKGYSMGGGLDMATGSDPFVVVAERLWDGPMTVLSLMRHLEDLITQGHGSRPVVVTDWQEEYSPPAYVNAVRVVDREKLWNEVRDVVELDA